MNCRVLSKLLCVHLTRYLSTTFNFCVFHDLWNVHNDKFSRFIAVMIVAELLSCIIFVRIILNRPVLSKLLRAHLIRNTSTTLKFCTFHDLWNVRNDKFSRFVAVVIVVEFLSCIIFVPFILNCPVVSKFLREHLTCNTSTPLKFCIYHDLCNVRNDTFSWFVAVILVVQFIFCIIFAPFILYCLYFRSFFVRTWLVTHQRHLSFVCTMTCETWAMTNFHDLSLLWVL